MDETVPLKLASALQKKDSATHLNLQGDALKFVSENHNNLTKHESDDHEYVHVHHSQRNPWLRACILGCNDGLVSTASLLMGVIGGGGDHSAVVLAGISGIMAGACSMAMGEWVSVASQRDAELADIGKEIKAQFYGQKSREAELKELQEIYIERGLSPDLAYQVAVQLSRHDVIRSHARDEMGIDIDDLASPSLASFSSFVSFGIGGMIPFVPVLVFEDTRYIIAILVAVSSVGLAIAGALGSHLGGASPLKGSLRVLIGGLMALGITYAAGYFSGA